MKDESEIYREAMELWGWELQAGVLAEECCELAKATLKLIRYKNIYPAHPNREELENFVEEMADVQIMLNQFLNEYLDYGDRLLYHELKKRKLERVAQWIERDKISVVDEKR